MFLSDVQRKEECRNEALQELRKLGVKCRPKKPKQQNAKSNHKVFKAPLQVLSSETVTLKSGQQIVVPKIVDEMCSHILTKVSTEGLFRKEGSKVRQSELKLILTGGGTVDPEMNHIVDIAALLKTFLRELPEPLIPYTHHELFLRCTFKDVKNEREALLLACLLLPTEHLNTLAYILQFLNEVSQNSYKNKMDAYNLAVVISPAIFPIEDKLSTATAQARTTKICQIIEILIINAMDVGIIPESIIEHLGSAPNEDMKKKKRRSGSLTRMFNGLKKMVGGKSLDDNQSIVTPDLLLTPINNAVAKRRKMPSNGISIRKKKDLISKLPENVLLSTPFTPCRTPISMDLSGTKVEHPKDSNELPREKKSQWFLRSRSVKSLRQDNEPCKPTSTTKALLERRWSSINPVTNLKGAKKRNSLAAASTNRREPDAPSEPDYIKVSKTEYEAIKSRVSAMERRISMEWESVQSQIEAKEADVHIQSVQTAYEQALVQSTQLSPTADQLAKKLGRELKIRRSVEQKIIRSPSARKIGSMRRKSRELEQSKVVRHQSWHSPSQVSIPRVSLRQGQPTNTTETKLEDKESQRKSVTCNLSGSSSEPWVSAEGFFSTLKSDSDSNISARASLARIRSQNAGMVLAKAKLFDKLSDSDSSNSSRSVPRFKVGSKIGSYRHTDSRYSYRVKALKHEDRKMTKKTMSPRRRNEQLSHKHKMQIAKQYFNSSSEKNASDKENIPENFNSLKKKMLLRDSVKFSSPKYSTPRIPHIKKPLNVKSPKRLCRTPVVERSTPLRVLKTTVQSNL